MNAFQIHRNSLAWILVAHVAVVLPHVLRLPASTTAVCAVCVMWRIMVFEGRWSYPGAWIKVVAVVLSVSSLVVGYKSFLGVDPWVGLVIVMFSLKLLEMHRRRDAYVFVVLAYFVTMTLFLYQQSIAWTAYAFLCTIMITAALIGLNQTRTHLQPLYTLRRAAVLLAQSIPLMLVLFVLFPRLPPLWSVPLQQNVARTGVTDRLRPGDIAELTQSDELAFRATFDGYIPPVSQLYWRGLVLGNFDADTEAWTQGDAGLYGRAFRPDQPSVGWENNLEYLGDPVSYSIMLEPTQQNWLFSLSLPKATSQANIGLVRDFRFYSYTAIRSKLRYDLVSFLDYRVDATLHEFWRYTFTRIPDGVNPGTVALARQMRAGASDDRAYIRDVLRMYNQQYFVYTLKPPPLGSNAIDGFLLGTRRGFCEHYAGSFVYLMRAAGIPARVVVGYLGGELNPKASYVEVRQYDAHAWTEVWLEGQGWVQVDPTSAVAPERIESGLEIAVAEEATFLADVPLSWMKFRNILLITEIRLQMSALAHYWDTFVVGYTPEMQTGLLGRLVDDVDLRTIGLATLVAFFGVLGLTALFILARRGYTRLPVTDHAFLQFCAVMARLGLPRERGEGPVSYRNRIAAERADLAAAADAFVTEYVRASYIDEHADAGELKRALRRFRLEVLGAGI